MLPFILDEETGISINHVRTFHKIIAFNEKSFNPGPGNVAIPS